ncbi:MAG: recombinase family protein [Thermomicrobiales bacterium]
MEAVLYLRVSSDEQARGNGVGAYAHDGQQQKYSLPTQRQSCTSFAASIGIDVTREYVEAYSAETVWNRPELNAMLRAMDGGEFTHIIVHSMDRLSRNADDEGYIRSVARRYGVVILSATEPLLNDESEISSIMRGTMSAFAQHERLKIIERTNRGKQARIAAGKYPITGTRPYGYDFGDANKETLVINEAEADNVRYMFKAIASGSSLRAVAKTFESQGIATQKGKRWTATTVREIVTKELYKGEVWANRTTSVYDPKSGKHKRVARPKEEWILSTYSPPQIVDAHLYYKANEIVHDHKKVRIAEDGPKHQLLLAGNGQAVCGFCGCQMNRVSRREKRASGNSYWRSLYVHNVSASDAHGCRQFTAAKSYVDELVWKAVRDMVIQPEILEAKLAEYRLNDPTRFERESLTRRIEETRNEHRKLAKNLLTMEDLDAYTKAFMKKEVSDKAAQLERYEEQFERVSRQFDTWKASQSAVQNVSQIVSQLGDRIDSVTSLEDRRAFMTAFGVRVRLFPHDHEQRFILEMNVGEVVRLSSTDLDGVQSTLSTTCAT